MARYIPRVTVTRRNTNNNTNSSANAWGGVARTGGTLGGLYLGSKLIGSGAAATGAGAAAGAGTGAAVGAGATGAGAGAAGAAGGAAGGAVGSGIGSTLATATPAALIAAGVIASGVANWNDHYKDVLHGDSTKSQRWDTAIDLMGGMGYNALLHALGADTIGETLFGRSLRRDRLHKIQNFLDKAEKGSDYSLNIHGGNMDYAGDTINLPDDYYMNEHNRSDLEDMVANKGHHRRWQFDWTDPYTQEYLNEAAPLAMLYKSASHSRDNEEQFAQAYLANRLAEIRDEGGDTGEFLRNYYTNYYETPQELISALGDAYNNAKEADKWEYLAAQNAVNKLYGLDAYANDPNADLNRDVADSHKADYLAYLDAEKRLGNTKAQDEIDRIGLV